VQFIADIAKTYLIPGSILFLLLALVSGVALLYGGDKMRQWGRRWLTSVAVVYCALSSQVVADWIAAGLIQNHRSIASVAEARGATTVVVLSVGSTSYSVGGQEVPELGKDTAFNVLEAARVCRLLGHPWVVASGGGRPQEKPRTPDSEMMRESLVKLGVPADHILLESKSSNTREQAVFTAEILRRRGINVFVLITAPEHMSRAAGAFAALGFTVVPSVSAFRAPGPESLWERLRPSRSALVQSDWAVYEYVARAYYWLQGWL
jgi:uncharacterized SAM-binding protein YcdF (DUF218 family)